MENTDINRKELEPNELEMAAGGRNELDRLCIVKCLNCGEIMQMKSQSKRQVNRTEMETVKKVFVCGSCGKTCTITPKEKGLNYQW